MIRALCLTASLWVVLTACGPSRTESATPSEEPAPAPVAATPSADPTAGMIRIPAGAFPFGATEEHFQYYLHQARINFPGMIEMTRRSIIVPRRDLPLPDFYIDRFEVTNQQYRQFVESSGYQVRESADYLKHWEGKPVYPDWAETFPVVWVSQQDAQAYCAWRNVRLPSEQEWEKAARGSQGFLFPWGNSTPTPETANFSASQAEPAGNRPLDKSPYEVYDLGGNVSELTSSVQMEQGEVRVVTRGGSYATAMRETLTFHRSLALTPESRSENVGFRCAADSRLEVLKSP